METLRLRRILHPAELERLLESYILDAGILPTGASRIRTAPSVPAELRGLVTQAVKVGKMWSCWTLGFRAWLFTAEMSLELSRERGAPVLKIDRYGDDGIIQDSGDWIYDRDGNWRRCAH